MLLSCILFAFIKKGDVEGICENNFAVLSKREPNLNCYTLIGRAGNSWDFRVDHLKMYRIATDSKLVIWTPSVVSARQETNLSVQQLKIFGSALIVKF